jgi:hypothetical protein
VPRISQFFGITIVMYFNDHAPPHFHAIYGGAEMALSIDTLGVLWGTLPRRAQALVLEWAVLHRAELRENWGRARQGTALRQIAPLE